jgi:7,8-dihydroneopterin aldolase/epimerase/oxygenase
VSQAPPATLTIFMRGLELEAEIGVYPHERGRAQPLVIDVELALSPRRVVHLADTLNYETLAGAARDLVAEGHIDLVETYAQRLAARCLEDPRVVWARVRVEKPGALPGARAAGVEVTAVRS